MTKNTQYAEKLRDPRWQKKRLETLGAFNWACLACGATDKTLHVHHTVYFRGTEPWDALNKSLVVLCDDCHKAEHDAEKEMNMLFFMVQIAYSKVKIVDLFKELLKRDMDDVMGGESKE